MARKIMAIAGLLWGLLFLLGFASNTPSLGFLPLCGLYPGAFSSGDPGYNPYFIAAWSVVSGGVFVALGFVAVRYRKVEAAVGFLGLFLASGVVFVLRAAAALSDLH